MGGTYWLLWQNSLLGYAWPLVVLAQIACLIHVLKSGRPYWWLWIIFGFPVIGLAAYVYLEVRPSWGRMDYQSFLWRLKSSQQRIEILQEQLAESTTIKNRLRLADELHDSGQFDREGEVLSEGLRGAFKDDATLLMRLAEAQLEAGRATEAEQILKKTVPEKSPDAQLQFALLTARVASQQRRKADAEASFQELVGRRRSEAPRYYQAEHLLREGRRDEALAILADILRQYRRGTVVWRFQERKWYYAAKRLLKSPLARAASASTKSGVSAVA
jgi:hypothetical protein